MCSVSSKPNLPVECNSLIGDVVMETGLCTDAVPFHHPKTRHQPGATWNPRWISMTLTPTLVLAVPGAMLDSRMMPWAAIISKSGALRIQTFAKTDVFFSALSDTISAKKVVRTHTCSDISRCYCLLHLQAPLLAWVCNIRNLTWWWIMPAWRI